MSGTRVPIAKDGLVVHVDDQEPATQVESDAVHANAGLARGTRASNPAIAVSAASPVYRLLTFIVLERHDDGIYAE